MRSIARMRMALLQCNRWSFERVSEQRYPFYTSMLSSMYQKKLPSLVDFAMRALASMNDPPKRNIFRDLGVGHVKEERDAEQRILRVKHYSGSSFAIGPPLNASFKRQRAWDFELAKLEDESNDEDDVLLFRKCKTLLDGNKTMLHFSAEKGKHSRGNV